MDTLLLLSLYMVGIGVLGGGGSFSGGVVLLASIVGLAIGSITFTQFLAISISCILWVLLCICLAQFLWKEAIKLDKGGRY